ncbi:MAG: hypothetical protein U0168_26375 [Nannocystaceae bacterium]
MIELHRGRDLDAGLAQRRGELERVVVGVAQRRLLAVERVVAADHQRETLHVGALHQGHGRGRGRAVARCGRGEARGGGDECSAQQQ